MFHREAASTIIIEPNLQCLAKIFMVADHFQILSQCHKLVYNSLVEGEKKKDIPKLRKICKI